MVNFLVEKGRLHIERDDNGAFEKNGIETACRAVRRFVDALRFVRGRRSGNLVQKISVSFKRSIICVHSLQTEKPPQRIGSGKNTWTKIISTNTTTGTTTVFGIPTPIKIFNSARHQQKANDIKESIPMDGVKAAEEIGHKVLFVRITVSQ